MAQGTPREQHVAQRQQHGQRNDDDHEEGADCCAIKQPPPASPGDSEHIMSGPRILSSVAPMWRPTGRHVSKADRRAQTGNCLRIPLRRAPCKYGLTLQSSMQDSLSQFGITRSGVTGKGLSLQ